MSFVQAINMWDVDGGMPQLDKYTYSEDPHVVAGACLGFGLCCCCVRSELDPAYALLYEHVASGNPWVRCPAQRCMSMSRAGPAYTMRLPCKYVYTVLCTFIWYYAVHLWR